MRMPSCFNRATAPKRRSIDWYSLGRYVDAFDWAHGAIGYHIASAECTTLREKDAQVWCKRMLEKGVAATIGPVNEPYVRPSPCRSSFSPP